AKFDYYRAKALQEEVLAEGSVTCSIVRSAQRMEFALNPAAAEEHVDEVLVADWYIQPIAVDDVAKSLVEVAIGAPGNRQIAGTEPIRLPDLARLVLDCRGDSREVKATRPLLASLSDGSLHAPADAELLGLTPQEWVR